jgi:DNA-3-methyladenine glycosylase II
LKLRFHSRLELPVTPPYRLDFTAQALRRLAANVVDLEADGWYYRALRDGRGVNAFRVRQLDDERLELQLAGRDPSRWIPTIERMIATQTDLSAWYRRARRVPWLARLADALRGLRAPRYPNAWEALAHAIVFQQISIHAAASIMRRTVEALSPQIDVDGLLLRPFPQPAALLEMPDATLRACGLSTNKVAHLRVAAQAATDGTIQDERLEAASTEDAIDRLCELRGIGRWSASVVMLRGFGRLDTFPGGDSGVARALRELSGDPQIDEQAVLEELGPVRGMLYFHLLLGRLCNLVPARTDW